MAGAFDIQRVPLALVDMLGMKATGDTPHQMGETVGGVVDMLDMYLWNRTVDYGMQCGVAPTVVGFLISSGGAYGQGPADGTIWLLYSAGIRYAPIAAGASHISAAAINRVGSRVQLLHEPVSIPASTGGGTQVWFPRPVIVRPGDTIGCYTLNITGVPNINPVMEMRFAIVGI